MKSSQTTTASQVLSLVGWLVAAGFVLTAFGMWRGLIPIPEILPARASGLQATAVPSPTPLPETAPAPAALGVFTLSPVTATSGVQRAVNPRTVIPMRSRSAVIEHTVEQGESVFEIANRFGITPETVLWANYSVLNDAPDQIAPGMVLNIPPENGVYYEWQEGDTLEGVAAQFKASVDDILAFTGNQFDLMNPQINPGNMVMIPGGEREFRQWIIPTIARGSAGVSSSALGPGACTGSYEGAYGSGAFVWPAANHYLSGNDYWSGHLAIDIAAGEGAAIYAADAGVVVFAGWAYGGYGNMIMIDHGNGYQTLYAHLSAVNVACGRSVARGATIGQSGNTGNSYGAHLHFEVRLNGGFVNPWYVLPAP